MIYNRGTKAVENKGFSPFYTEIANAILFLTIEIRRDFFAKTFQCLD